MPKPMAAKTARNAPAQPQLVAAGWPLSACGAGAGAEVVCPASPAHPQNTRTADAHIASVPGSLVLNGVQGICPGQEHDAIKLLSLPRVAARVLQGHVLQGV